jgi:hypothetical protein
VGFSPDAPRLLRTERRVGIAVRNLRAATLSLALLVAHWAFASLHPALRALGSACRDPKTERPLTRTFCFSIHDNYLFFRF